MADLGGVYNAEQHLDPEAGQFDALPAGKYQAVITDSEIKDTKQNDGKYIKFEWSIIEGQHKGRKVWTQHNILNKSQKAQTIGQDQFSRIIKAAGLAEVQDTAELHGVPMLLSLKVRKSEEYGEQNDFRGVEPSSVGTPSAHTPAQAAAVAAAPPPWG